MVLGVADRVARQAARSRGGRRDPHPPDLAGRLSMPLTPVVASMARRTPTYTDSTDDAAPGYEQFERDIHSIRGRGSRAMACEGPLW